MFSAFCCCKSNKPEEDVLDPTTIDIMNMIERNEKNKKIDELNVSLHNGKNKGELNVPLNAKNKSESDNFGCFSFFDDCYKIDVIKRVHFSDEYA